ncbi:MAG: peptide-methionine (R)-S-oxide reductase MsrB [Gemmatimonadaceae bacterium]|nr:peptide-methionine (R)-S-oxide reductase MsrB [Gemmatimonadaceae bacterium]
MRSIRLGAFVLFSAVAAVPAIGSAQMQASGQSRAAYKRPSDAELKKKLTPIQFAVTRKNSTETPYKNQYWNNHEAGIYVDLISGAPLFSSLDKYESHTGWPSFTRPLDGAGIRTLTDNSFGGSRTEVRSVMSDSHLGHLFDDGPAPSGNRYCMNSAALRFVPVARLAAEGYGRYLPLFKSAAGPGVKH